MLLRIVSLNKTVVWPTAEICDLSEDISNSAIEHSSKRISPSETS